MNHNWSGLKRLVFANAAAGGGATPLVETTVTGNPATFVTDVKKPLAGMTVPFTPTQSGSGDPNPENVRSISGWSGTHIRIAGKNLINATAETNVVYNDPRYQHFTINGNKVIVDGGALIGFKFQCKPLTTYTYSFAKECARSAMPIRVWADTSEPTEIGSTTTLIVNIAGAYTTTFTTDANTTWIIVGAFVQASLATPTFELYDFMLELGSTATAYEPHSGATYPISWQTEAGTVYGGELNTRTGMLTITDDVIASYNGEALPSTWISDRDVYSAGTTPTTGAQVVYKLATPRTVQLTPHEVTTLIGTNTIWTDTNGTNTITYLKKE